MVLKNIKSWMDEAIVLAMQASARGEVPIGAVVVKNGAIIGRGYNLPREECDPTAHAEIIAIRDAAKTLGQSRLNGCDLWVTLEPCAMCAGAISHSRIDRLYYAASDEKGGAIEHGPRFFSQPTCHHQPEVYSGVGEEQASALLKKFFALRR